MPTVFQAPQPVVFVATPPAAPQANTLHTQIQEITERRAVADKSRAGDRTFMQLRQAQQMASVVSWEGRLQRLGSNLPRLT